MYTYATGHTSFDIEERIRQTATVLDHLADTVPGVPRLEGVRERAAVANPAPALAEGSPRGR